MAYQLSDLVTEVQTKAKDPSFDRSLIGYYIRDVHNEVLGKKMFSFMEQDVTGTLAISDVAYSLSNDVQAILGLRLTDPTSATTFYEPTRIDSRTFFRSYPNVAAFSGGAPINYTQTGALLKWSSKLDKAYNLEMLALAVPTQLEAATDVPNLPVEFREILTLAGLAGVEGYRRNFDVAAVHRRRIEELTEDMTIRYGVNLGTLGRATTRGR